MSHSKVKRFVKMPLPKVAPRAAEPGTTAYEYLSGRRNPQNLTEDDDLWGIVDDKHPDGGLLYVFKDHSSVFYIPNLN